jgi:hypothetical protein
VIKKTDGLTPTTAQVNLEPTMMDFVNLGVALALERAGCFSRTGNRDSGLE